MIVREQQTGNGVKISVSPLISFLPSRRPTDTFLEGQNKIKQKTLVAQPVSRPSFELTVSQIVCSSTVLAINLGQQLTCRPSYTHITSKLGSKGVDCKDTFLFHKSAFFSCDIRPISLC